MPYEIRVEEHGVYKRFWGHVSGDELISASLDLHGSEYFERLRYSISDFSAVESYQVREMDVRLVAGFSIGASQTNDDIVIAVVTQDPKVRALVEHFGKVRALSFPVAIFNTVEEARDAIKAVLGER